MNGIYKPDAQSQKIAAMIAAQTGNSSRVCELAFGHTAIAKALATRTTLSYYLGIDSNEAAVTLAQREFAGDGRFDFSCVTLQDWKPSVSFDVCTAIRIFHHLSPEVATEVLKKMTIVLNPVGRIVLLDSLRDYRGRMGRWLYLPYFFVSTLVQQAPRENIQLKPPEGEAATDAYYCLTADISRDAWHFRLQLFSPSEMIGGTK